MRLTRFFCYAAFLIIFAARFTFAQYNSAAYVPGELLVKYKNGARSAAGKMLNASVGAEVVEEFPDLGWQRVKMPADLSLDQALAAFKSSSDIEYVQPNYYYHLLNTPSDVRFSELYGLQKISAPAAWDLNTGSSETVVANIDTGILYTHEDLAANMWHNPGEIPNNGIDDDGDGFVDDYYGYDFFYNDSNPIDDAGGHGTHTSGTIGAVGNNSLGVVGVNWNVKLMAIKIYSPKGTDSTSAMLINAYNYIRMMKNRGVNVRVTNNSYGDCGEACGYDQATKDAIDALADAGVLQVFAAGNNGRNIETTPFYPASYTTPGILTVAASDQNDNRAGFSNYGTTSVDLAAPGVGILSTYNASNNAYVAFSGTSMATPHVTGAAALLSSYRPDLSVASLKATLMNTVDLLPQWSNLVKTGGRLNVARALQNPTICTFTLDRTSQIVPSEGGNYTVSVTAPTNCDFSAKGSSTTQIVSGSVGSGNSIVTFNVPSSSNPRNDSITIAGQTFTITQTNNCAYTLDFTNAYVGSGGSGGSFTGTTQTGCSVNPVSNASFISVKDVTTQSVNGVISFNVAYTVDANTDLSRSGTVSVGSRNFTVNQATGGSKSRKRVRYF